MIILFHVMQKQRYYDYIILRHQEGDTKTWFNFQMELLVQQIQLIQQQ
jgi:hypothetical protein